MDSAAELRKLAKMALPRKGAIRTFLAVASDAQVLQLRRVIRRAVRWEICRTKRAARMAHEFADSLRKAYQ